MRSILIIGSSSLISKELINLHCLNDKIIVAYFEKPKSFIPEYEYINVKNINKIKNINIIYFISAHMKWGNYELIDTKKFYLINVELLKKTLLNFPDAKIILASSISVYGDNKKVITEKSILNPQNEYSISKIWAEEIVKKHKSYSIVRIGSILGKNIKHPTFIPKIINEAKKKKTITLFGDGKRKQHYIHYKDVAKIMFETHKLNESGIYLAVNPNGYSNFQIAKLVIASLNKIITIKNNGVDNSNSIKINPKYTLNKLGIKEMISIEKSIIEMTV